jgi:hypothetical protein
MALGLTHLTEMSTRNLPEVKGQPGHLRLATLLPSVSDYQENAGASTSHNPMGLHDLL